MTTLQDLERIAREATRHEPKCANPTTGFWVCDDWAAWQAEHEAFLDAFDPTTILNLIAVAKAAEAIASGTDTDADHVALIAALATLKGKTDD